MTHPSITDASDKAACAGLSNVAPSFADSGISEHKQSEYGHFECCIVLAYMVNPADPLKFPDHFPPTDKWKKFFIGVRWLGPDLSFFPTLKSQQALRSNELMTDWGGGIRQEIAETVSEILHKKLHWRSSVFLPKDKFNVICHGPRFDMLDEFALEEAIEVIGIKYGVKIPNSFWHGLEDVTFGEFVEEFMVFGRLS